MKRRRFSEEQIIGVLKEPEAVLDIAVLKAITGKSGDARRELAGERRRSATGVWVIVWRARASRRTTRSGCVSTARNAGVCAAVVAANGRWARARR